MRKRTWLLGVLAVVVVLPVAALGVAAAVIDPNAYKPRVEAAVERATGRVLSLNGPLRIGLSLWPTIEVSDVKLANLPGGTRPDMARAERIEARLALLPLLWRQVEVSRLTLIGPNILFEEVGGKPNWVFTPPADPARAPAASPGTPRVRTTLRFRSVHVQNGMVTRLLPRESRVLGVRSLDLQHLTDGGPISLTSVLIHADQPFSVDLAAQPEGSDTGPWRTQLNLAANGASAQASGTATLVGGYDLQVEAKADALEALAPLLPQLALPPLHQVSLVTHLSNGASPADLPVVGATRLHVGSADLASLVPGLRLGAVDVTVPAAGGMATVAAAGSLGGEALSLAGRIGTPAAPAPSVTLPVDIALVAHDGAGAQPSGSLALKGTVTATGARVGGVAATVALHAPALASFRPMLAGVLPGLRVPALTGVSLAGGLTLAADHRSLGLDNATLATTQGDAAGQLTIGLGTQAVSGTLRSNRLDLDALLALSGTPAASAPAKSAAAGPAPAATSSAATATGPVIPDRPLPWGVLRGPTLDLTASIGTLQLWRQSWQGVELALQLKDGRLRIDRFGVALPGGALAGSLTADASTDRVPVDLVLQGPGVPLALITQASGLPGPTAGTVRVEAKLHGTGRSAHELAASLDGQVGATMGAGSLSNAALLAVASDSLRALRIKVPAEGETAIRCLAVIGSFARGVGTMRTIALDTSHLQLDGNGQVDLGAETLSLKLHPLVRLSGASVSVPVLVDGPFRAVHGRLDADGIAKAGLMIDALLGGDRPDTCAAVGLPAALPVH